MSVHLAQNHKLKHHSEYQDFSFFSLRVHLQPTRRTRSVCCLGRAAVTPHLRLWWPYILGAHSRDGCNAAINAIESAGDTAWNRDFGDTKGVVCALKCQNMMRESCERCYVQIYSMLPSVEKY